MKRNPSTVISNSQLSRRQFLQGVASLGLSAAGLAVLDACRSQTAVSGAAEEALETTTIRLTQVPAGAGLCLAPQYLAEELLHAEGFTEVQYIPLKAADVGAAEQ